VSQGFRDHCRTCVQQQQVTHDHVAVEQQARVAAPHPLDLDHVLLRVELAELQVLLEVVDGACAATDS
jgi:hypothetical protein